MKALNDIVKTTERKNASFGIFYRYAQCFLVQGHIHDMLPKGWQMPFLMNKMRCTEENADLYPCNDVTSPLNSDLK